jgi:parvulin-like peptidyl-prolyl isomerase
MGTRIPVLIQTKTNMKVKKPKIKAPKVAIKAPKLSLRKVKPEVKMSEAIESLPRITNETVAEHREELLRGARKYIYPLEHTKHRVITVSAWLLSLAVFFFFVYTGLSLYKFQSRSSFLYYVTRVVPFPIAKAGPSFVAYENYLFELRHYTHYYSSQQQVDFNSTAGKQQLAAFKKQALQQVIDQAYTKQLASKYHVSVSNQDVNNAEQLVRNQNRLGSSNQEFADVLKEFWGWSVDDFRRELKSQLLAQKVVAKLDTGTNARAAGVLAQLNQKGADFANIAKQYSDDTSTKENGGEYGYFIDKNTQNLAPQVLQQLLSMQPGQVSGVINAGYSLEIDKVISINNGKIRAAHIVFNFKDINTYIKPLEQKEKPQAYIHV